MHLAAPIAARGSQGAGGPGRGRAACALEMRAMVERRCGSGLEIGESKNFMLGLFAYVGRRTKPQPASNRRGSAGLHL